MAKVTFDGTDKLIIVNNGITSLDVQIDLYSDWKEWLKENDNAKFLPAMRTVGGDPTTGTKSVAPYFFLTNGWKIRPFEENHELIITGNLFVDEPETYGNNIIVPTIGSYNVLVNMVTTSDAIISVVETGISGLTEEESNQLMMLPSASDNANAIWNESVLDHTSSDSFGEAIDKTKKDVSFVKALSL